MSRLRHTWQRIRRGWKRTDTIVLLTNLAAFGLFIGNCWWESVNVAITASAVPLAIQARRARLDPTLRSALLFGALTGFLWPLGEWFVVNVFGWWGSYTAPGFRILETPFYCVLIGWLSSAYLAYLAARILELEFRLRTAVIQVGITALALGFLGENLFVSGGMWTYDKSGLDWYRVPAFVPIAYALGYAALPLLRRFPLVPRTLIFTLILLIVSLALGLATGFFPR
jgi:hypothetical protein